jgi:hypothetical protein
MTGNRANDKFYTKDKPSGIEQVVFLFAPLQIKLINKLKNINRATPNEHITKMAALPPQTILCRIERLSPAGTFVEAATAPICQNVRGNFEQVPRKIEKKN